MRYLRGSKGTSIIEVLVVMVVLLIGILTVIRIFPPGFLSVRRSEAMTLAGRLAQQEMERWTANSQNLPEGIVPIGTGTPITVLSDQFPGPPVDDDNALSMRRVIGETTRIPFGGWSTGPSSGSVYMLAFAPIDPNAPVAVRGGNLSRRYADSRNTEGVQPWDYLAPFQYAIDYDDKKIAFPRAAEDRVYWLSISWWEQSSGSAPAYRSANNVQIVVPANTADWLSIPVPVSSGVSEWGFDDNSDTVCRGFRQLSTQPWSASDPYEYKLLSPALGIITFNPLGYARKELGRPLEARIDYDILDLQIIREDRIVPTAAPFRVGMTLNHIKQYHVSLEPNGDLYEGIEPFSTTANPVDYIVVDLETGLEVNRDGLHMNYKDGTVDVDANIEIYDAGIVPSAGRHLRFLYKAELDWSLQLQKAFSVYSRTTLKDNDATGLDYRSYAIHDSDPGTLWFSACNANSTVSITYEWDDNGTTRKVVGECLRTGDKHDLTNNPWSIPAGGTVIKYVFVKPKHTPTRIFSVSGVSVRARVQWQDSDKWRNVDLDTTLLKKAATY